MQRKLPVRMKFAIHVVVAFLVGGAAAIGALWALRFASDLLHISPSSTSPAQEDAYLLLVAAGGLIGGGLFAWRYAKHGSLTARQRLLSGFLVAPFGPLVVTGVAGLAVSGDPMDFVSGGIGFLFDLCYPVIAVIGLPAFIVFRRLGWMRWWQITLGGTFIGVSIVLLLIISIVVLGSQEDIPEDIQILADYLPIVAFVAASASFTFWLIARPARLGSNLSLDADAPIRRAGELNR